MIEEKVPGIPRDGFNGMEFANPVAKGRFMYNAGAFASDHVAPGTPGYASTGDTPRMVLCNQYTHSGNAVYPVNKFIFETTGSDQDQDTIPSGARLLYYIGGEYETDEYDITVSGTGTAANANLWLNSSGQLAVAGSNGADPAGWGLPPVAQVIKVSAFPTTNRWFTGGNATGVDSYKKTLWYRLYPYHAMPVGTSFPSL
jgi:hypothetical protein